jgi:hypothetical protein
MAKLLCDYFVEKLDKFLVWGNWDFFEYFFDFYFDLIFKDL